MAPKILGLDLSTTKTGWAIGELNSGKIDFQGRLEPPANLGTGEKFHWFWECIGEIYKKHGCQFIVIEELNSFVNAITARALGGLAGVVAAQCFAELHQEVLFINTTAARGAVGVNLSWETRDGKKVRPAKGYQKKRVTQWLDSNGIKYKGQDEADAIIIVLAAGKLLNVTRPVRDLTSIPF